MHKSYFFVKIALILNVIVLVPVVTAILLNTTNVDLVFGKNTEARLILTSIYIAITVISGSLLYGFHKKWSWALPMAVGLFSVQIVYKLLTVLLVGIYNPVIITNLMIVTVQAAVLINLWRGYKLMHE